VSGETAKINWGDDSVSVGTVSEAAGDYMVIGTHSYAVPGTYILTITASDGDPVNMVSANATANIVLDTTPPTVTVTGVTDGAVYTLGAVPEAGCDTQDAISGVATPATLNVTGGNANGVGVFTATCSDAADNAGNTASASVTYHIIYSFEGFLSPVVNPPALNVANAGQTIPLKWRITDANGNPVLNLENVNVSVVSLSCPAGATTDQVEEFASGNSGLQNLGDGYYQFNWKTPKNYAKSCKTLKLDLDEGSGMERIALFQFNK
jgi:hypothetical protein